MIAMLICTTTIYFVCLDNNLEVNESEKNSSKHNEYQMYWVCLEKY